MNWPTLIPEHSSQEVRATVPASGYRLDASLHEQRRACIRAVGKHDGYTMAEMAAWIGIPEHELRDYLRGRRTEPAGENRIADWLATPIRKWTWGTRPTREQEHV